MTVQYTQPGGTGNVQARIQDFLARWDADQRRVRAFFQCLLDRFAHLGADLDFVVRDGVSASLRACVPGTPAPRPLFCLVDVVVDPGGPWLSVCFYADAVTDPRDLGNLVPSGLLGEDGHCFDVEHPDGDLQRYVLERVREAMSAAA